MSSAKPVVKLLNPKLSLFPKNTNIVVFGRNSNKFINHVYNNISLNKNITSSNEKNIAINYLQFNKNKNKLNNSLYLSARFEHFKDDFDVTLKDFLLNKETSKKVSYSLNGTSDINDQAFINFFNEYVNTLKLTELLDKDLMLLSNGQMRRSRIAQLLIQNYLSPNKFIVNLIDDFVIGLDLESRQRINTAIQNFQKLNFNDKTTVFVVSLRPQDTVPEWCDRLIIINDDLSIEYDGKLDYKLIETYKKIWDLNDVVDELEFKLLNDSKNAAINSEGNPVYAKDLIKLHKWYDPIHQKHPSNSDHINLKNIIIQYRSLKNPVLNNFNWKIDKKSRWILKGNNGSGKSTITSLLTLDHPQAWANDIYFNKKKLEVGKVDYERHNANIACSSPELHNFILSKNLTVKEVILSGLNKDSNNQTKVPKYVLDEENPLFRLYDNHLAYWNIKHLENDKFNGLSLNDQKLVLFIRSLIKLPELLILDEAFSGMDMDTIKKCHFWLHNYWCGSLILIGHSENELIKGCLIKEI
ncbi:uncharacterized protein HGUI_00323 [Hanseniaspora guilliermondii]|uniref:ABC transporter domain-containing protein n=1 Tax=Hanseniaspora guilliermondii TaxID=56406 RepID=A0A1L0AZJ8_9ASCO|nr:uncharacterized protein HGUI_00323 [Hanseniaspora guilliermondii]